MKLLKLRPLMALRPPEAVVKDELQVNQQLQGFLLCFVLVFLYLLPFISYVSLVFLLCTLASCLLALLFLNWFLLFHLLFFSVCFIRSDIFPFACFSFPPDMCLYLV